MQFTHHDLGNRRAGETIEVSLSGNAANVRLMDSTNFNSYRRGARHTYYGGLAKRSPVRLVVPRSGRWHVTVDLGGLRGSVRSAIRVLPGALPPIREADLGSMASLVRSPSHLASSGEVDAEARFDVFISHASEDKDAVARPLAHALRAAGLSVWLDEVVLKIGDSLRRKIGRGIARSRFGVVVLSASFFRKGWTNYELDGLVTRSVGGEQILLPIWHEVSTQEVIRYSPSLADKVARSTATQTIEEISAEIVEVIEGDGEN